MRVIKLFLVDFRRTRYLNPSAFLKIMRQTSQWDNPDHSRNNPHRIGPKNQASNVFRHRLPKFSNAMAVGYIKGKSAIKIREIMRHKRQFTGMYFGLQGIVLELNEADIRDE